MQIEWKTEEDEEGRPQNQTISPGVGNRAPTRRRRPWWRLSLLALLLAAAALWGVYFVLQKQLEAVSAAAKAELLAVHDIVQQAERDRDEALLGSMISPTYPNWGSSQKRMMRNAMRWDRTFFGLTLARNADDEPPTAAVADIAFTSDWRMATVTLAFPYEQADGPPVTLHQTVTYRDETAGWALVPAYPAFWGERRTATGRYLTVEYPERDAATVERLVADWDKLLASACQTLDDLHCGRRWKLEVELSTESGVLARIADPVRWLEGESGLKLPTPSIIGRPVDDAGYQALRAGYAPLIMGAGIADIVGWRCCEKVVFFRALLDKQLSELGLIPWPITAASYEEILQGPIHDVTNLHWVYLQRSGNNITPQIWNIVYSIVDFILAARPERSPIGLQRSLRRFEAYRPWLLSAGFNSYGRSIQKEWIHYANQQLAASDPADPVERESAAALPAQDLQLLCAVERFHSADVYRYDMQSGAFVRETTDGSFRLMYSLPDDDGVLLQRSGDPADGARALIWRQGQAQEVAYRPNIPLYAMETAANGMLFYAPDTRRQVTLFTHLDLADCAGGACAIRFLDGFPVWSPDRERTIVSRGADVLWLGDHDGQPHTAIARGDSAVWLDDGRFAFIQRDDAKRVDVMTLPRQETGTLVEMEMLAEALTPLRGVTDATLISPVALATHPTMPDRLFVAARVPGRGRTETTHIFAYSLSTGTTAHLLQIEHPLEPVRSLRFSADGRWLFVHSVERSADSWHLHLYNNRTGESLAYSSESQLAFPGYDLSADGEWLVRVDDGFFHLIPLHGGRQRLVAHDFSHCYAAVWVERNE